MAALAARPAHAQLPLKRWTFERPSYGSLARNIADDFVIKQNGVWHLFYTNLEMPDDPVQYIGHAVSTDLIEWTEHTPVLVATLGAPEWRRHSVWAPMVTDRPGGGWIMAYTGVSETHSQRIGFLTSDDLENWTPLTDTPFEPDSSIYSWTATGYANARDPHIVLLNGVWHLLYCARTVIGLPAVGYAESPDLINWTHHDALLTQGFGWNYGDVESPGVTFFGGKAYLFWSWGGCRVAQGDSLQVDWQNLPSQTLEAFGTAPELIPSGNGLLFSRRRLSPCVLDQTFLWFDSLSTASWPFQIVPRNPLSGFTLLTGNAFSGQPSFGDGQAARGEQPASPAGFYWLSSREYLPEPYAGYTCGNQRGPEETGVVTTDPFLLNGDTLAVCVQGADSPDSAYVLLRDECTGTTIVRFSGGSETLTPKSAWVGNARGRNVSLRIADLLERPGGWIGVDEMSERASAGLGNPPARPVVGWVAPVGGEGLPKAKPFRIRWTMTGGGVVDSLVLYLTDPQGEVLLRQRTLPVTGDNVNWVTPDTVMFAARLRIVAYAHSGAWGCATSQIFQIGTTVGIDPVAAGGGLRARYDASGVWLEGRIAPHGEEGILEVFDLRGRRVAVPWRGRDGETFRVALGSGASGAKLAPGMYFARLKQGASTWHVKVVQTR